MKTTKCDRCGVTDTDAKNDVYFVTLNIKIGFSISWESPMHFNYDICGQCKPNLHLDSLHDLIIEHLKKNKEEKE